MTSSNEVVQAVARLCWDSIDGTTWIHPRYLYIFTDLALISACLVSSGFSFVPGLLDILRSDSPPDLAWFLSLPKFMPKQWGVYFLVFTKSGHKPRFYVGSATEKTAGLRRRMQGYLRGLACNRLPKYVEKTFGEGYELQHFGILASCQIPSAGQMPRVKVIILILEAVFSATFWAFRNKNAQQGYGLAHICPWSRSALP